MLGLLSRSLGIQAMSMEDPAQPLMPYSALIESLGLGRSDAGVLINEKQAMRLTTAHACIKVISEDLSRLSLDIFQEMPDGSMRLAAEHRCYPILHDRPNPNMSSMIWRGTMLACALAWGNSYSWIKRDRAARVVSLVPLASDRTSPVRISGALKYATTQTETGAVEIIDPENILHFMGMSLDGVVGLSPIQTCKNAFGLGLAAEKFGAQFFGNGARTTGILSHPETLDPEAHANLKKSIQEWVTGESALRPIILEEGMTWNQVSVPPDDAQFIQTRKFQKSEVAALFRVPMHLLQDLERATNNNIEHQGLDYTRFCLAPWAVRMEQEINFKLLGGNYFSEHNLNELQRGDFASQTAGFSTLRNIGVYSSNDILRALRENPIPEDEGGDVRTVQGAMIPLSSLVAMEDDPAVPETAETDSDEGNPAAGLRERQITAQYQRLFRDAIGRIGDRANLADPSERDQKFMRRAIYPLVASMTEAFLAMRFGNVTMTDADKSRTGRITEQIIDRSADWKSHPSRNETASRLARDVYESLAKELL